MGGKEVKTKITILFWLESHSGKWCTFIQPLILEGKKKRGVRSRREISWPKACQSIGAKLAWNPTLSPAPYNCKHQRSQVQVYSCLIHSDQSEDTMEGAIEETVMNFNVQHRCDTNFKHSKWTRRGEKNEQQQKILFLKRIQSCLLVENVILPQ